MTIHDALYTFISSLAALFPVINPFSSGILVQSFLRGLDDQERKSAVRKIFINCLGIGLGSLLLGHLVLLVFGLAVPVIQVGGGIIICKTGYDMLSTSDESTVKPVTPDARKMKVDDINGKIFYPISFPICLGPGTISVIFTLMATTTVKDNWMATGVNYGLIFVALTILLILLYIFLIQGGRLMKKLGASGNMIISKFIAFLTFCIGIQIIVTGISKIFHLSIL